jgi:alkanesulfonate monooxygenase SsuD/methylene tetrahydromethanopterin reductase-like flavin-dependent oxidoreductase (luciferase family)
MIEGEYAMTSFGLLLPTREAILRSATPDFREILALAEAAEGHGFDSVWVGDSILARPRFEPLTTLAAIAARVPRVKLGTAVLVPAMRQPVVLANEIASLDHVTEGRLILGLGIGGTTPANAREFAACGLSIDHRVGLYDEGLTVMLRLWAGEEVTFHGRHLEIEGARLGFLPIQRPYPPIWLAGAADSAYRRLLRIGDAWFPISASAQVYAAGWDRITALGPSVGRDPSSLHRALYVTLVIDEDESQALREMKTFIEGYYGVSYEVMARNSGLCAGNAEHCVEWLQGFIDAGVQTIVVRFGSADQRGQLDRWQWQVLPYLQ